jgi:hypothetical protein
VLVLLTQDDRVGTEAHSCDHTCKLPCAGGADGSGHRRFLAEIGGWLSDITGLVGSCPLDTFEARLINVNAACCSGDAPGVCEDGIPQTCSYQCGRLWTSFYSKCEPLLSKLVDGVASYSRFTDRCMDVDPMGMALALRNVVCTVCGNGEVADDEECDEGDANSNAPGASCRTNCLRARCGDDVVDPGELCDDGMRNSNQKDAACRLDCKLGGTDPTPIAVTKFTLEGSATVTSACEGMDPDSYERQCPDLTGWHESIDMSSYYVTEVCNVVVLTGEQPGSVDNAGSCQDYCAAQGRVCRHAQDNIGAPSDELGNDTDGDGVIAGAERCHNIMDDNEYQVSTGLCFDSLAG